MFENPDGTTFVLHEVRYMPSIGRNLISLGTVENNGCEFIGSNGLLKVVKSCTIIMKGARKERDNLYVLEGLAKVSGSCNALVKKQKLQLNRAIHNFGTVG